VESNNLINRVNSETIHRGEYINLRTDELEKNGKIIAKRDVVEHVGSIVAVPYEINDQNIYFYLVRQWRNPLEDWVLEFPAGTLNSEENHEIAVVRELQEEIGMRPTIIDYWSYLYVAPGWCTEKIHCYMAGGLKKSKLISDVDEQIEVVKLSQEEIFNKIKNLEIIDLKTISAFNIFQNYYKNDFLKILKK